MAKVTIKEIAELANVSPAAVSMAIRGRKGISEETRANILHIAQSMGYRSPQRSRTLCGESIFFLLDEAPNPLCSAVLAALAAYVRESGGRFCVLPLEQALALFQEGTALVRSCNEQLDRAQLEVVKLMKTPDGTPAETEYVRDE